MIDAWGRDYAESDRDVDLECSPVWGWSRLHRTAAYCVDLYAGSTSKPWVNVEKCAHCGQPAEQHKEG